MRFPEMILRLPDDPLRGMALRATAESLRLAEEIVLDEYRRIRQHRKQYPSRGGEPAPVTSASALGASTQVLSGSVSQPEEMIFAQLLIPAGHFAPKHRLHCSKVQVCPIASSAI